MTALSGFRAELSDLVFLHINSIYYDIPDLRVVEAHYQVNESGLARATLSYDGNAHILGDLQVETLEDPLVLSAGVSEPYVLKLNLTLEVSYFSFTYVLCIIRHGIDVRRSHDHLEDLLCRSHSCGDIWAKLSSLCSCESAKQDSE